MTGAELVETPAVIRGRCDITPPKTSHHAKRIVRRGRFSSMADKPELTAARQVWQVALAPFAPLKPLEGPLRLELELTWPWRQSDSARKRAAGRIPCDVKPDCDNIAKTIIDVMVLLGFLRADQQVVRLSVAKWIGDRPGLDFAVWTSGGLSHPSQASRPSDAPLDSGAAL